MEVAARRADGLFGYTQDEMAAFPDMSRDAASRALGERIFGAPTRQWAQRAQAAGRQAWVFEFAYGPNPALGACHCSELPFVFGNLDTFAGAAMLQDMEAEHGRQLTVRMQSAWIEFIHGRSPGWAASPAIEIFE